MRRPIAPWTRPPSRWRGQNVSFASGSWNELREQIPQFESAPFAVGPNRLANPNLRMVVRKGDKEINDDVPVGVVSHAYSLVQHRDLGDRCVAALCGLDLFYDRLPCEVGLSTLGEWMTLRLHLDDEYSIVPPDGHRIDLRIEVFNSVDGSSRLLMAMSWFRLVCSNGLVVRNTLVDFADVHDHRLDLSKLENAIASGLRLAKQDRQRLITWAVRVVAEPALVSWVDVALTKRWGKKAAARCLLICRTGWDGEFEDAFASGRPSERAMRPVIAVPGAAVPAKSEYDVAQALSWTATTRGNVEERLKWQADIPSLLEQLRKAF